jgi:hypothetical protein
MIGLNRWWEKKIINWIIIVPLEKWKGIEVVFEASNLRKFHETSRVL